MKFRKLNNEVELPEKSTPGKYINIRASERIDIKPYKERDVKTGVEVLVPKNEICYLTGPGVLDEILEPGKYRELIVTMYNAGGRTMMIYPGQIIASVTVEVAAKKKTAAKKPYKKATFSTKATLVPEANTIFSEG